MKKTLQFLSLSLALLLLTSCSLLSGGTGGTTTTAPSVTTAPGTAAPSVSPAEADALFALLKTAAPTSAALSVSSVYSSPAVTLTAEILFLRSGDLTHYSYATERLLTASEAIAAGSPTETVEGHLTIDGAGNVTSSSAEITNELLSLLPSLSLRLPALESALFSSLSIERVAGTTTVGGAVKDEYIPSLLAPYGIGADGLSVAVTLTADSRPAELTLTYTSAAEATVTATVVYSYGEVTIPD